MLKFFVYVLGIFMVTSVLSQTDINKFNAKGEKHGKWRELYESSKIPKYEGEFVNGKPVGTFTYYYPNKVLKSVMVFDKNPDISRCTMYDENGKKNAFGKYVKKEKDSVWTYYSPPGYLSYRESYRNGLLHGEKLVFYPPENDKSATQQVFQQYAYMNGKLEGPVKEYFPNGKLKLEGTYKDDNSHGEWKKYHPNGKLFFHERYKNGKRHGWWSTYDENGKELGRVLYQNGKEFKGPEEKKKLEELKAKGISPNSLN
jgi:antitoxin component YwqK of YwqJK toxin-antitoxin module